MAFLSGHEVYPAFDIELAKSVLHLAEAALTPAELFATFHNAIPVFHSRSSMTKRQRFSSSSMTSTNHQTPDCCCPLCLDFVSAEEATTGRKRLAPTPWRYHVVPAHLALWQRPKLPSPPLIKMDSVLFEDEDDLGGYPYLDGVTEEEDTTNAVGSVEPVAPLRFELSRLYGPEWRRFFCEVLKVCLLV